MAAGPDGQGFAVWKNIATGQLQAAALHAGARDRTSRATVPQVVRVRGGRITIRRPRSCVVPGDAARFT